MRATPATGFGRAARQIGRTAALVLVWPLSVAAQEATPPTDPLAAAWEACTLPEISLAERLYLLAGAGWLTAGDSPSTREWQTLMGMMRFPSVFRSLDPKDAERLANGLTRPADLGLPPNLPLTLRDMAEFDAKGGFFGASLSNPGLSGFLLFSLRGGSSDAIGAFCTIVLAEPIGDDRREAMVDARAPLETTPPQTPDGPEIVRLYKRPRSEGGLMTLQFTDVGPTSTLHELTALAGYAQSVRTYLTTQHGTFPVEGAP